MRAARRQQSFVALKGVPHCLGIASSYIATRLAANRPMGHALALGVLGLVVSIVGAVGEPSGIDE